MTITERQHRESLKEGSERQNRIAMMVPLFEEAWRREEQRNGERDLRWFVDRLIDADADETKWLVDNLYQISDSKGVPLVLEALLEKADGTAGQQELVNLATKLVALGPKILLHLREFWQPPESMGRDFCLLVAIARLLDRMELDDLRLALGHVGNAETWMTSIAVFHEMLRRLRLAIVDRLNMALRLQEITPPVNL